MDSLAHARGSSRRKSHQSMPEQYHRQQPQPQQLPSSQEIVSHHHQRQTSSSSAASSNGIVNNHFQADRNYRSRHSQHYFPDENDDDSDDPFSLNYRGGDDMHPELLLGSPCSPPHQDSNNPNLYPHFPPPPSYPPPHQQQQQQQIQRQQNSVGKVKGLALNNNNNNNSAVLNKNLESVSGAIRKSSTSAIVMNGGGAPSLDDHPLFVGINNSNQQPSAMCNIECETGAKTLGSGGTKKKSSSNAAKTVMGAAPSPTMSSQSVHSLMMAAASANGGGGRNGIAGNEGNGACSGNNTTNGKSQLVGKLSANNKNTSNSYNNNNNNNCGGAVVNSNTCKSSSNNNGIIKGISEFINGVNTSRTSPPSGSGGSGTAELRSSPTEAQMKWSRNNIAATMERYEPSASSSSMSSYNSGAMPHYHHDYSYAYYEPGAAMRHTNIPGNAVEAYCGPDDSPGPSRPPPPNSIRALLSKSQRNKPSSSIMSSPNSSGSSSRHTYTTRYGTQENIYEEIGSDERLRMMMMSGGQSMISLDQSMVEEEFRRVQNRHRRVLGELNLSVEAMIMPSTPPNDSPGDEADDDLGDGAKGGKAKARKNEFKMQTLVHPMAHERLSGNCGPGALDNVNDSGAGCSGTNIMNNNSNNNGDLDSGFSGSSSGASYVGSLRYHRNSSGLSNCCPGNQMANEGHSNGTICEESCRSFQRGTAQEDPGMSFSTRSWSSYSSSKSQNQPMSDPFQYQRHGHSMHRSAEDPGPRRADIINMNCANMCSDSSTNNSIDSKSMNKSSFWSMKGWRKFSRFSSTSSVNKAGCINF